MKSRILLCCTVLALFVGSSTYAQNLEIDDSQIGEVAYSGNNTPADIMIDRLARLRETHPEAEISFTVTIPVVRKGKTLVRSKEGLPVKNEHASSTEDEVTLTVPFETAEFEGHDSFDADAFYWHVEDTLERMRVPNSRGKKAKGSMSTEGAENQPNCGGYPLGSVITTHESVGCLGTVVNEYTCQSNPVTGGKDWYNTGVQIILPEADCFPGDT